MCPDVNNLVNRTNGIAEDARSNANNGGAGLTATLTENVFFRSFGDGSSSLSKFQCFFGAPRQVIGQGIKNIQVGIKTARPYQAYAVGDTLTLHIENRTKIFESRIGDLKLKLQVSLDLPPNGHVDKFINPQEYATFISQYKNSLSESMSFTIYELIKIMFISSSYDMCMPYNRFERFLLGNLVNTVPPARDTTHAISQTIYDHADTVRALVDEFRQKITNCYIFDVQSFVVNRDADHTHTFNPYNPWDILCEEKGDEKLKRIMATSGVMFMDKETDKKGPQITFSREESLKAFSLAISTILSDIIEGDPKSRGGQGNRGNIVPECTGTTLCTCCKRPAKLKGNTTLQQLKEACKQCPECDHACRENCRDCQQCTDKLEADVYPDNRGTNFMNKQFHERGMLKVKSNKENLVLIMSLEDYKDFLSGDYEGYFGSQSMAVLNFKNSVVDKVSEIIPIPGMIGGHAIIMDKRMFAIIPHLDHTGRDTLNQRLATVDTIHKGFIFGIFDQFVGVRIQMTSFNARPIDSQAVYFEYREKTI